jgi:CubicO group peptidase (beta-lactamase class C family)
MGRLQQAPALFLLFLLASFPVAGQGTAATDRTAQVDAIFAPWNSREKPGCTVAVGEKGKTILSRAYGMADLEHDVPITTDTIFEAGSVSKQFTAAAALLLVQQGKLSLQDDVRKYIPELPNYGTPITIDHLIHHTSGLRDWGAVAALEGWPRETRIHTHAHMLDIAARQKALNYAPGAEFSYTNTGYNLLVLIIERVSGQTFPDFTRQNLFVPLGMTHTQWRDDFTRVVKGRAIAYTEQDGAFHSEMPFENVFGNGGLLTTVGDLLLWNENFVHGKVGGDSLRAMQLRRGRLTDGREIEYAGGLFIGTYKDLPEVSHGGATAGYRAFLARYPEQGVSVAVLCNVAEANPEDLGRRTVDLFLPAAAMKPEPPAPQGIALAPEALAAKAILYRDQSTGQPWRLALVDGRLKTPGGRTLVPLSESLFYAGSDGVKAEITAGPDGRTKLLRVLRPSGEVTVYEPVTEAALTPEQLAGYAGEYTSDEANVIYRVTVEEGALVLRAKPDISFPLKPVYTDAFQAENGALVRFYRGAGGKITEMSLGIPRVRDLRFVRK